jgi:hypothetical protein
MENLLINDFTLEEFERIRVGPTGIVRVDEFEVCDCNCDTCPEAEVVLKEILLEESREGQYES